MNYWIYFSHYAFIAIICWLICMLLQVIKLKRNKMLLILLFAVLGGLSMVVFTYNLWQNLGRPPMRTLGETRLWYAVFLPLIGIITYIRWQYKWLLNYSLVMATVFLTINYFNPDTYNKALMPALQSVWFVPHVLVYIFSYALLAASSIVACYGLFEFYRGKYKSNILHLANNLVYVGFGFSFVRFIVWSFMGKRSLGTLLDVGPKRNMGNAYLVRLFNLHTHALPLSG